MKISKGVLFFTFRLEPEDYRKYGQIYVNAFFRDLKNNVPAHQRSFFPDQNEWQIHNDCRREFDRLVAEHLTKDQLGLFDNA
jgi:hypothetical protein